MTPDQWFARVESLYVPIQLPYYIEDYKLSRLLKDGLCIVRVEELQQGRRGLGESQSKFIKCEEPCCSIEILQLQNHLLKKNREAKQYAKKC